MQLETPPCTPRGRPHPPIAMPMDRRSPPISIQSMAPLDVPLKHIFHEACVVHRHRVLSMQTRKFDKKNAFSKRPNARRCCFARPCLLRLSPKLRRLGQRTARIPLLSRNSEWPNCCVPNPPFRACFSCFSWCVFPRREAAESSSVTRSFD